MVVFAGGRADAAAPDPLPAGREPLVPLPFLPWGYDATPWGERRNRGGEQVSDLMMAEHGRTIARHARAFGLPPRRRLDECLSRRVVESEGNLDQRRLRRPLRH